MVHVTLDATGKRIAFLTSRLDIENAEAKVVLGRLMQTLVYPLPIVGSQCKVRTARKSSYVEVCMVYRFVVAV